MRERSMTYEPIQFWTEQGKTYLSEYRHDDVYKRQEYVLIEYLKNLEFKSVLELGCGFGRLTNLLLATFPIDVYVGLDVSPDQLSHIKPRRNLMLMNTDILKFSTDMKFDLVLSAEVLMHQPPSDIQAIVDKMKSWSKKHIINIDYYKEEKEELVPYSFKHDYPALYTNARMIQIAEQALFHCEL